MMELVIASWSPASQQDRTDGLLGFVQVRVGGTMLLDCIAVRRTRAGKLTLSYPERTDRYGVRHAVIRPINDAVRLRIEHAVFSAIGLTEGQP